MKIVKLSGAGNDFVVLGPDEFGELGDRFESWVRRVCRRGLSVGADGVLLVEPSGGRVRVRFWNPDGGEAFCGNGTRCAARFAHLRGWVEAEGFVLDTRVGAVEASIDGPTVRVTLPPPGDLGSVTLDLEGEKVTGRRIDAGVPHLVVAVAEVTAVPLARWGPLLRRHPRMGSEGANVDVVSIDGATVRVRTWERGVEGETLSCGTGAVAAAFAARIAGAGERIVVTPASGIALVVELPGPREAPTRAVLEGDARVVFEGTLHLEGISGFAD